MVLVPSHFVPTSKSSKALMFAFVFRVFSLLMSFVMKKRRAVRRWTQGFRDAKRTISSLVTLCWAMSTSCVTVFGRSGVKKSLLRMLSSLLHLPVTVLRRPLLCSSRAVSLCVSCSSFGCEVRFIYFVPYRSKPQQRRPSPTEALFRFSFHENRSKPWLYHSFHIVRSHNLAAEPRVC